MRTRTQLANDWKTDYPDIIQQAHSKGRAVHRELQAISPQVEGVHPNEPKYALGWLCDFHGIILRDDRDNGVISSPVKDIFAEPHKAHAFACAVKANVTNGLRAFSWERHQKKLAFGIEDFAPGSSFRPYVATPLRDGGKVVSWPPMSSVIASVTEQDGDSIQIPEFIPNEDAESYKTWRPGTPIPLDTIGVAETTQTARWYAGGIKITEEMRNGNADLVMMHSDKSRIRLEQQVVDEILPKIAASPGNAKDVGLAGTPDAQTIIGIGTAFTKKDYVVTTLLGRTAKVEAYLGVDRSGFWNDGNREGASAVAGGDQYGKGGINRLVYDVDTDTLAIAALPADEFLGFDASETADMFIASGSDKTTDTYVERERTYEIAWTFKYLTSLRIRVGEDSRITLT